MSKLLLFASVAAALVVSTNAQTWTCYPYNTPNPAPTQPVQGTGQVCAGTSVFCIEYPNCNPADLDLPAYESLGSRAFCVDGNGIVVNTCAGPAPAPIPPQNTFLAAADTCYAGPTQQACIRTLCAPILPPANPPIEPVNPFPTPITSLPDDIDICVEGQFSCQNNCVNYEQEITRARDVYCVSIGTDGIVSQVIGTCNVSDPSNPARPVASIPATAADCPDFAGVDPCKTCCSSTIYNASVRDVEVAGDLSIKIITEKGDDGVKVVAASEETAPGGILAPIIGLKRAVGSILRGGL